MKIKRAFWTCSSVLPAVMAPLAISSCGCSQAWGYKTPISIGSNIKGSYADPYLNFSSATELVDLDGQPIVSQLQSNYSIDSAHSTYYGYSLPQKWDSNKVNEPEEGTTWNKGGFVEGSAKWLDYSSSDFTKSNSITGTWTDGTTTKNVSKTVYSYRNNTLASNIELVSLIGSTISQYINYALQYQGTQIGTEYAEDETNTDLAIAWGGGQLSHGKKDSDQNRQFMENIFAGNGVSGTGKSNAVLRPSQVSFNFDIGFFPIVAYKYVDGALAGVSDATKTLLNGEAVRPSSATKKYYSSVSEKDVEEQNFNHKTGQMETYKFKVYTYTNVPVVVYYNDFVKSYVNPTINNSFMISDYYSDAKTITSTIGDSWKESLPKYATVTDTKPAYRKFTFVNPGTDVKVTPAGDAKIDGRINDKLTGDCFIALLNYSYKECTAAPSGNAESYDRATMTGMSTIFPAYLCDKNLGILGDKESFFKLAKDGQDGYIFDTNVVNKYSNLLLEIYKRTSGQGLVVHAKDLNDTSKKLLKFLGYMFGDSDLKVNTAFIRTTDIDK